MKCFFFLLLFLLSYTSYSQSTVPIRGDTIDILKVGGNAELRVRNATRARTGGFLRNRGGGLTEFAYAFDSAYVVGDSIRFRRGDGYIAIKAGADAPPTLYTADWILTGPRVVDLNGHSLDFTYDYTSITVDPAESVYMQNGDGTGVVTRVEVAPAEVNMYYSDHTGIKPRYRINAAGHHYTYNVSGTEKGFHLGTTGEVSFDILNPGTGSALKQMAWDSVNKKVYAVPLGTGGGGTYTAGYGLSLTGSAFSADSLVMATRARQKHVIDSLVALMPSRGKVTAVAITGTSIKTLTVTNADGTTAEGTFTDIFNTYSTTDNAISISGTAISTRKGTQTFTDGATITINCSQGYNWKGTIAGNRTLAFSNAQDGDIITVYITQDATGGRTMTWPAGTVWINPSAPTLKTAGGGVDRVVFHYVAGTWYGSY